MATQQIEFSAATGLTLTATLHAAGSDAIAYTASAVVEQTNRKGVYRATFAGIAAGTYQLVAFSGSTPVAVWWGFAQDTASTFVFGEISGSLIANSINSSTFASGTSVGANVLSISGASAATIADEVRVELATELARIDVATSTRLATAGYTAPDNASIADIETKVDTLLGRITANLFTGITYLRNWLSALAGKNPDPGTRAEINATTAGATYNETTDSLEAITGLSGLSEVDANLVAINGQPISAGQLRLNVINTNVLKNSVLTLMRKDTYSVDNGNPIDFVSDDLPDMTIATGATLTIMSKARVVLLTKSGTVSEVAKRIRFELTEANTTLVVANDNRYDVVLNYATGHQTVFSGINVILDDWS
jgi:hypothetical protein